MSAQDLTYWLKDFWNEFKKVPSGIIGVVILLLALAIVFFEHQILPFPDGNTRWRDITYWDDNPKSAPPVWTNIFRSKKLATSARLALGEKKMNAMEGLQCVEQTFDYDYQFDSPPLDIIIRVKGKSSVLLVIKLARPDNFGVELLQAQFDFLGDEEKRLSLDSDARKSLPDFLSQFAAPEAVRTIDPSTIVPTRVLFAKTQDILTNPQPLKGKYRFTVTAILMQEDSKIHDTSIVISGSTAGLLGTDSGKRDIFTGIIAGTKWALLLGILTALISVGIGVVYGVVSAYFGGVVDTIMSRVFEIFVSVPLLPVLIVMSAVFKPSIWVLILMMCCFFWTGPVKTVRSMALQLKEETYIEATRALGGSHLRLIFKHMVPILIPYSFASMALSVPSAIVYEATISLIGLGDATIVTWGQILHDALTGGAVLSSIWWWVIPPGLMISLMGMTFAFIGFAMDKILHPKLRTR
jgi:peptide/nickel transport system permease protein